MKKEEKNGTKESPVFLPISLPLHKQKPFPAYLIF